MKYREEFGPLLLGEIVRLTFTFADQLASGETISTASVEAFVVAGVDSAPEDTIVGSATISESNVTQRVEATKTGIIYLLICTVTTSTSQTLKRTGYLATLPEDVALCTAFTVNPTSINTTHHVGSTVVSILGSPEGCTGGEWIATPGCPWITVSPSSGTGPQNVTVSWTANTGAAARSCQVTVTSPGGSPAGGTNIFTVNQAALAIGTTIYVTMIGGGGGGCAGGSDTEFWAGGGGAGEFIYRRQMVYNGEVGIIGSGGAGRTVDGQPGFNGGDTIFGAIVARGGGRGTLGTGGRGAGNVSITSGANNTLLAANNWSGANGGGQTGDHTGGDSIVNSSGAGATVAGGAAGVDAAPLFSSPGGGGAASPWGAGGAGGNCNGVADTSAAGDSAAVTNYGAGGGGGGSSANTFGNGGDGAPGYILIELS